MPTIQTIDNLTLLIERGELRIGDTADDVLFMLRFYRRAIVCGITPEAAEKAALEFIAQLKIVAETP